MISYNISLQYSQITPRPVYTVVTGPRLDSDGCHAKGCAPDIQKTPTHNYNKLLVVAPSTDTVISCGSVSQGACDTYRRLAPSLNYFSHYFMLF